MSKTPEEMAAAMKQNIEAKTGKALSEWRKIVAKRPEVEKHGQIVKLLKTEHGVTHGYANLIAHESLRAGETPATADDLVEAQYAGPKETLRPIYDALVDIVETFGKDTEIAPKKAYVSLRRSKQFGLIQPSTRTRVDLGLNLKGVPATARLEASGSFNAMVSHRIRLGEVGDIDQELENWMKQAYEMA